MNGDRCIAPLCGRRAVQKHHCVYAQELRRYWRERYRLADPAVAKEPWRHMAALLSDDRNLVPLCHTHHELHHLHAQVLPLRVLPDSVFEFALAVLGPGPAHAYLERHYEGHDDRLELLIGGLAG